MEINVLKYFKLIRKSLLWSIPSGIMMVMINFLVIHKNDFSYLDIISPLVAFILIAGPIYCYLISSKKRSNNGNKNH
jgi:hypothetical protein